MPVSATNPVVIGKAQDGWVVRVLENGKISTRAFSVEILAANYAAGQRLRLSYLGLQTYGAFRRFDPYSLKANARDVSGATDR